MAKSRAMTIVRQPAPVIRIQAPRMQRVRAVGRLAARHAKRGIGVVARHAYDEKHTLAAVFAGAAVGFAEREGIDLPHFDALGMAGTYGVVAWAAGKYLKSRTLSHVATGFLSIGAYQLAKGGGKVSGEF